MAAPAAWEKSGGRRVNALARDLARGRAERLRATGPPLARCDGPAPGAVPLQDTAPLKRFRLSSPRSKADAKARLAVLRAKTARRISRVPENQAAATISWADCLRPAASLHLAPEEPMRRHHLRVVLRFVLAAPPGAGRACPASAAGASVQAAPVPPDTVLFTERFLPHDAMRRNLGDVACWVFDLDNTLYPATSTVYVEVEARMNDFIMAELKLDLASAIALRKKFFEAHGTTLRGLMNEYGLAPGPFLDYVHELDLSALEANAALHAAIGALPGRKLIFTNSTRRHAERVLARLGLAQHFGDIHDIECCEYLPKPDPSGYQALLARHGIDAGECGDDRRHGEEPEARARARHDDGLAQGRAAHGRRRRQRRACAPRRRRPRGIS